MILHIFYIDITKVYSDKNGGILSVVGGSTSEPVLCMRREGEEREGRGREVGEEGKGRGRGGEREGRGEEKMYWVRTSSSTNIGSAATCT